MSLAEQVAVEEELARRRARGGLLAYVLATNPAYEVNWHHRRICQAINAMQKKWTHRQLLAMWGVTGKALKLALDAPHPVTGLYAGMTRPEKIDDPLRSLHIAVPPRCGKSTLASMAMPAWWFGNDPNAQLIATSYSADLASRMNRTVQREIDNPAYKNIFPGTRLNAKNVKTVAQNSYLRNSDLFEIVDHKGVYRSAGVAGGVTGMGASCFIRDALVLTEKGPIAIGWFWDNPSSWPKVWAFDGKTGTRRLCKIKAVQRKIATRLVTASFSHGRSVTCTPEHLFWATKVGYRPAAVLADCRCTSRQSATIGQVRAVRDDSAARHWCRYTPCALWCRGHVLRRKLLQSFAQGCVGDYAAQAVQRVRQYVSASQQQIGLLLSRVRRPRTGAQDFWGGKPDLQTWQVRHHVWSRPGVLPDEKTCQMARQKHLCNVCQRFDGETIRSRTPYRRRPHKQHVSQFDKPLQFLSFDGAQERNVRCTKIDSHCSGQYEVFDIQVEDLGNFYCNSLNVKNCAIIDDPLKNRESADSAVIREGIWEWYGSTLYTRLHKGAVKMLIMTRWHEDDLGGRVLSQAQADPQADQWFAVVYPAILDHDPTPGDPRQQGEVLWPSHFPLTQMETTRATIGTYEFEALYQQRPAPREGGIIKTAWLQYYKRLPDGLKDYTLSADLTFGSKSSNTGDFVAIQMWAAGGADRYLVDQIHGRMEFTEQIRAIQTMCRKYPQCRVKLIEDAANGRAAISVLRSKIPGLIAVRPAGSKQARLEAVSPQVESGNVYLPSPDIAPWVQTLVHELASFPNAAHDDCVDALSQALARMSARRSITGGLPLGIKRNDSWLNATVPTR